MEMSRFSEEAVTGVVPIIVYWAYSGVHMALGHARLMDKNMVSKRAVFLNVLAQHLMQLAAVALLAVEEKARRRRAPLAARMVVAVLVFDAYRYAWHRLAHSNRFLYRHLHSWHHRIVVPYAFGAIYGHPIEVLIDDTASGLLAVLVSGLSSSPRATAVFLSLCNIKGIDNHCGLCLLPRRLQSVWNGAAHHGLHHMPRGIRHNFSDSFLVTWDKVFGTHMPYAVEERPGGQGLVLKPMPLPKAN